MKVSISKSVARAFEILEVFHETRKALSATEIRRSLGHPHSSVVAVLHNLVEVGYLDYDRAKRTYFPTHKLYRLGSWVQSGLIESAAFRDLAAAIATVTQHTTAVSGRSYIFLNIIHTYKGRHPTAVNFPCGIGSTLFKSVTGTVILSQMTDTEIQRLIRYSNQWSKNTKADLFSELDKVMEAVGEARQNGYAIGYDGFSPGVGAIAYPLLSPFDGTPLSISVSGRTDVIKPEAAAIQSTIETYLSLHNASVHSPERGISGHSTEAHG
jgi:DNA-binding IclR family transcriptional regulator